MRKWRRKKNIERNWNVERFEGAWMTVKWTQWYLLSSLHDIKSTRALKNNHIDACLLVYWHVKAIFCDGDMCLTWMMLESTQNFESFDLSSCVSCRHQMKVCKSVIEKLGFYRLLWCVHERKFLLILKQNFCWYAWKGKKRFIFWYQFQTFAQRIVVP